jgi:hypothetical protein
MTQELLFRSLLPSTPVVVVGVGAVAAVVAIILVQRAARFWVYQHRSEQLRDRVSRVEARWRQAAL